MKNLNQGENMDSGTIAFKYARRFGMELELNSLDKRDFNAHPLDHGANEQPKGIDYIAEIIQAGINKPVEIHGWHITNNNSCWVIKPDRSCGMELCSPVLKGWPGIKEICQVADILKADKKISIDNRCSLHLHVDVSDCNVNQVANILGWWVKCESVFLDSVPVRRKRNQYCQCIGMMDLFEHDSDWDPQQIIKKLGANKYYTVNCYHYLKQSSGGKGRPTLEFRIIENAGCVDSYLIKNWIRLIVHFVEMAKIASMPNKYNPNDPWTGFCWLDPEDVMRFLGFSGDYGLSKGMEQTRNWFLGRLNNNISKDDTLPGVWSEMARKISRQQISNIVDKIGLTDKDLSINLNPEDYDLIYSDEYKY